MRIGLVAPPFIPVPPVEYGGTELFLADLARGLQALGQDVVIYTNGESRIEVEKHWLFEHSQWPPKKDDSYAPIREIEHTTWAIQQALGRCDVVHLNGAIGLGCSRLSRLPFVYTLHHPTNHQLSESYARLPRIYYVCISHDQRSRENLPRLETIHHGIDLSRYRLQRDKRPYLSFIGRFAPIKGAHLAIEVAKRAEIPLKIAGEIQPLYRDYFETKIRPQIDGRFVEYIGQADLAMKQELLGNSMAMLFPITWNEPFGLVMIEAMACGTPVLALAAGSVPEIVRNGISGYTSRRIDGLVRHARDLKLSAVGVRQYVEQHFSKERMARDYCAVYNRALNEHGSTDLAA